MKQTLIAIGFGAILAACGQSTPTVYLTQADSSKMTVVEPEGEAAGATPRHALFHYVYPSDQLDMAQPYRRAAASMEIDCGRRTFRMTQVSTYSAEGKLLMTMPMPQSRVAEFKTPSGEYAAVCDSAHSPNGSTKVSLSRLTDGYYKTLSKKGLK